MKRILLLWLAIMSVVASCTAHAQTYAGLDHINRIITNTPGISLANISGGGMTATATGAVAYTARSGLAIPVATTATATFTRAGIAAGAATVLRQGIPIVGAAITGYQVYQFVKDLGVTTCPPPDFFCKPPSTSSGYLPGPYDIVYPDNTGIHSFPDPATACQALLSTFYTGIYTYRGVTYQGGSPAQYQCMTQYGGSNMVSQHVAQTTCSNGAAPSNGTCQVASGSPTPFGAPDPVTGADPLADAIANASGWPSADTVKGWTGIQTDINALNKLASGLAAANPMTIWANQPFQYSAPPVTTSPVVVSTQTIPQADGSTHTKTTTETITVTPTPSGSTIGNASLSFAESVNKTTTETDSTGKVVSTSTSSTTPIAPATPAKPDLQIPTDYAREATLQKVETDLNTDAAPTLPDQNQRITDAHTANQTAMQNQIDQIQAGQHDKSAWFSWVWTPPVGSCQKTSATVGQGIVVGWDICGPVSWMRDILGWLMAIYSAIQIYGEIFTARE